MDVNYQKERERKRRKNKQIKGIRKRDVEGKQKKLIEPEIILSFIFTKKNYY